jgi:hypothetical protein
MGPSDRDVNYLTHILNAHGIGSVFQDAADFFICAFVLALCVMRMTDANDVLVESGLGAAGALKRDGSDTSGHHG